MRKKSKGKSEGKVEEVQYPPPRPRKEGRIPFSLKSERVFMGCPKCEGWIDVTRVFTEQYFDGVYSCPHNHRVVFGGVTVEKSKEAEKA